MGPLKQSSQQPLHSPKISTEILHELLWDYNFLDFFFNMKGWLGWAAKNITWRELLVYDPFFKGENRSNSLTLTGRTFSEKKLDRQKLNRSGYRQNE